MINDQREFETLEEVMTKLEYFVQNTGWIQVSYLFVIKQPHPSNSSFSTLCEFSWKSTEMVE